MNVDKSKEGLPMSTSGRNLLAGVDSGHRGPPVANCGPAIASDGLNVFEARNVEVNVTEVASAPE
jgi:hypothetical protein